MKKIFIVSLIVAMSLLTLAPALANDDRRNDSDKTASTLGLENKVKEAKEKLAKKLIPRAVTFKGELVKLSGTTLPAELTVKVVIVSPKKMKKWTGVHPEATKEFTFKVTDKTVLTRGYGAKSSLSEMAVGDQLRVVVKHGEDGTWTAKVVKDNSVHMLWSKKGTVESIDVTNRSFVLKQDKRVLTVKVSDKTKFLLKGSTTTTFADLKVGDAVAVKGVVNTNLKVVEARTVVIKRVLAPSTEASL
ncbi:MAG: DUF5666 domain-containing protein [Patescibacteria group bacterium]